MKYCVEIAEVHYSRLEVELPEGTPRAEIVVAANKKLEEDGTDEYLEYSHTLDDDVWKVRTEAGDFVA